MSTKGTLTLTVTEFTPWDAQPPVDATNCCKATATLEANDRKIQLDNTDPTNFVITIYEHGRDTTLSFIVQAPEGGVGGYTTFAPVGIAFKQTSGSGDGVAIGEFPETTIDSDKDGNRVLTLSVSENNEDAEWDFYLVIQGVSTGGATNQHAVGIIDPRVRGTAGTPP